MTHPEPCDYPPRPLADDRRKPPSHLDPEILAEPSIRVLSPEERRLLFDLPAPAPGSPSVAGAKKAPAGPVGTGTFLELGASVTPSAEPRVVARLRVGGVGGVLLRLAAAGLGVGLLLSMGLRYLYRY